MAEEMKGDGPPRMTAQLLAGKYRGKREIYNVSTLWPRLTPSL